MCACVCAPTSTFLCLFADMHLDISECASACVWACVSAQAFDPCEFMCLCAGMIFFFFFFLARKHYLLALLSASQIQFLLVLYSRIPGACC